LVGVLADKLVRGWGLLVGGWFGFWVGWFVEWFFVILFGWLVG
jgi:hypothetical protein